MKMFKKWFTVFVFLIFAILDNLGCLWHSFLNYICYFSSQDSHQNGQAEPPKPDPNIHGPKTQEDVMAEERATKLKQEKEMEGWWGLLL